MGGGKITAAALQHFFIQHRKSTAEHAVENVAKDVLKDLDLRALDKAAQQKDASSSKSKKGSKAGKAKKKKKVKKGRKKAPAASAIHFHVHQPDISADDDSEDCA